MRATRRALLALVLLVCGCGTWGWRQRTEACGAGRPHVYLVVIDGLGADLVDAALMPHVAGEALGSVALRGEAVASMPTRTNPNHVTLVTGLAPEDHGVTGNDFVDRADGTIHGLDAGVDIEAPTFFTIAETMHPEFVTVAVFSKDKLGGLFDDAPGRQHRPDFLWVPARSGRAAELLGSASDRETMDAFLAIAAEHEPDLAVLNLSEVDRSAHRDGPAASGQAREHADAAIGRLVDDLHARGRWQRSVVVITADHGFDDVSATPARPEPSLKLSEVLARHQVAGVRVVADGGLAHVYADGVSATTRTLDARARRVLARAAAEIRRVPGVAEVVARLRVPGVPSLADVHPDWRLVHERAGDLLVIAAPGYQFVEQDEAYARRLRGNHGSPRERRVPLVIAGGALDGVVKPTATPSAEDVGATVGSLLGLGASARFDGRPVRPGTPLALPLRAQSPHCAK